MNAINYRVSLDMFDVSSQVTIKCKKGDSACKIHITLTKSGKIYNITEGCSATFSGKKADGNFVYDNCTIEGNTIVYDFTSSIIEDGSCQITACEGNVDCEVALFNDKGEQLTSPRFVLVVDGTVYNGEEILSTPDTNVLKELIVEANELIDEMKAKLEIEVDQAYNPGSENAQSGKAVAEALTNHYTKDEVDDVVSNAGGNVDLNNYYTKDEVDNLDAVKYVNVYSNSTNIASPDDNTNIFLLDAGIISVDNGRIVEVGSPVNAKDAATKGYVDGLVGDIETALDELHNYAQAIIGGAE